MPYQLQFWHPAIASRAVTSAPTAVKLCGEEVVLFRDRHGKVGALEDRCPHRRMRLSNGCVRGGRLVCPYHGWSFGLDGHGTSPGNPTLRPKAKAFDVTERHGYCWIREDTGAAPSFPLVESPEYDLVHGFDVKVRAPVRLLMDNMAELEHTAVVHQQFAFGPDELGQITMETRVTDDKALDVLYEGPQRRLPWYASLLSGMWGGDRLFQSARIRFTPLYGTYELVWTAPGSEQRRIFALRFVIFYNPIDESTCQQVTFTFLSRSFPQWLRPVVVPILVQIVKRELRADVAIVESLPPDAIDASRHQLGQFDRPLVNVRKLVREEYLGIKDAGEHPAPGDPGPPPHPVARPPASAGAALP